MHYSRSQIKCCIASSNSVRFRKYMALSTNREDAITYFVLDIENMLVLESNQFNENHFNISFPIWYIFFISVWYLWHWLWPININAHRFLHWLAIWYSSSCISISTYRGMFFVWPRQKHDSYPRKINGPTINDRLSIMRQFEYLIWSTWTHTHQNVATKTSWGLMNEWK